MSRVLARHPTMPMPARYMHTQLFNARAGLLGLKYTRPTSLAPSTSFQRTPLLHQHQPQRHRSSRADRERKWEQKQEQERQRRWFEEEELSEPDTRSPLWKILSLLTTIWATLFIIAHTSFVYRFWDHGPWRLYKEWAKIEAKKIQERGLCYIMVSFSSSPRFCFNPAKWLGEERVEDVKAGLWLADGQEPGRDGGGGGGGPDSKF